MWPWDLYPAQYCIQTCNLTTLFTSVSSTVSVWIVKGSHLKVTDSALCTDRSLSIIVILSQMVPYLQIVVSAWKVFYELMKLYIHTRKNNLHALYLMFWVPENYLTEDQSILQLHPRTAVGLLYFHLCFNMCHLLYLEK